ncbi:hypothetical protein ES703_37452 [subsurface metagenome]
MAECTVCEVELELMAVLKRSPGHEPEVICFACLALKYPVLAARVAEYLTEFKGVRVFEPYLNPGP